MHCERPPAPLHLVILHIAHVFGGAERTTANLLQGLDRSRFGKITLIAPAALRVHYPDCDDFVDLTPHAIGGWFTTPTALARDARRVVAILDGIQPAMVLGIMHYPSALLAAARLMGMRLPLVVSFRGPLYEHMRHYESSPRRRLFLSIMTGMAARIADLSIVPSEGTRRELINRFHAPAQRVLTVANGIDFSHVAQLCAEPLAAGEAAMVERRPLLCTVARLSVEKNLSLLLHAFALVRQRHDARLLVIGEGELRPDLELLAHQLGVGEQVVFAGARRNVFPLLAAADIFIHTCIYEGFGYAMLEAMACGVPVVATDCPYGPREVIGENEFGRLAPAGDAKGLSDTIGELLDRPEARALLAEKGLQRARELSIARMIAGFEGGLLQAFEHFHTRRLGFL